MPVDSNLSSDNETEVADTDANDSLPVNEGVIDQGAVGDGTEVIADGETAAVTDDTAVSQPDPENSV